MAVETAARPAVRRRAAAFVRTLPAWAWIAGIVVVSIGVRYLFARRLPAPWIMVDELIYSELAKSFAATGHFLLRGDQTAAYGVVYPALLSPAWALFSKVPDAYTAAKVINSVVMSLAAVPAYLLARKVISRPYAIAAAALTVAVPSTLYAGMLMTENAFYPAFLLAALATVAWLEKPTTTRTAWLVAAVVLAFLTRAGAIAIVPALLTAPFLVSGRKAFREYRLLLGGVAAAAIVIVIVQVARGASPFAIFGAYQVATSSSYTAGGVLKWLAYHWGELVLSLGVVPFAVLVLQVFGMRERTRPERAFIAASVTLSFWLVLEVATFASEQSLRIEERNMFYVAPLFFVALLLWIERGAPRPRVPFVIAGALAVGLVAVVPYGSLIGLPAISDTPSLLPLWTLATDGVALGDLRLLVILASAAAIALFFFVPRRYALVLPVLVLAYFAVSYQPIHSKYGYASGGDIFVAGLDPAKRDWIDRKVGGDASVAVIWSGNTDKFSVWENEFFNRSVRRFYYTQAPLQGDLPETALSVDRRTGLMSDPGKGVVSARYVLTDASVGLRGRVVARDKRNAMLLYRVGGPLRQISRVDGLYPADTWSGPTATYTRLDCSGGTVTAELQSDPAMFKAPQTVTAVGERTVVARVAPRETRQLTVPLRVNGDGLCTAVFRVTPTAIPKVVTHGANPDPRVLGIHFNRFTYRR